MFWLLAFFLFFFFFFFWETGISCFKTELWWLLPFIEYVHIRYYAKHLICVMLLNPPRNPERWAPLSPSFIDEEIVSKEWRIFPCSMWLVSSGASLWTHFYLVLSSALGHQFMSPVAIQVKYCKEDKKVSEGVKEVLWKAVWANLGYSQARKGVF